MWMWDTVWSPRERRSEMGKRGDRNMGPKVSEVLDDRGTEREAGTKSNYGTQSNPGKKTGTWWHKI